MQYNANDGIHRALDFYISVLLCTSLKSACCTWNRELFVCRVSMQHENVKILQKLFCWGEQIKRILTKPSKSSAIL